MAAHSVSNSEEIWKPVTFQGFREAYSISNHGRLRRNSTGYILKATPHHRDDYPEYTMSYQKKRLKKPAHVLVAYAFLGEPPGPTGKGMDDYQINHIDGDKTNNHVSNLEWCRRCKNVMHAVYNGLHRGNMTAEKARFIKRNSDRLTPWQMSRKLGICDQTVKRVLSGQTWGHINV